MADIVGSVSLWISIISITSTLSTIHAQLKLQPLKREVSEVQNCLEDLRVSFGKIQVREPIRRLNFHDLRKKVRNTTSDLKRYINLGWIGVSDMLSEQGLDMGNVMEIWGKFYSFPPRLQHLFLKSERFFIKMLYLVLFILSFSEFPNKLRPLCTTMPWTIWPCLVVLWGVCWMFFDEFSWNWGNRDELPMVDKTSTLSGSTDYGDLSHGKNLLPF